jgi:hypothetical protein
MIQISGAVLARSEACLAVKIISENLRDHYKRGGVSILTGV